MKEKLTAPPPTQEQVRRGAVLGSDPHPHPGPWLLIPVLASTPGARSGMLSDYSTVQGREAFL